jgi:hypothetical protein
MKNTPISALVFILALALASCTTTPYVQKESDVMRLVRLINEGKVTKIEGLTPAPFILDTETLYLENDVSTLWTNLKSASFAMTNAKFVKTEPVNGESWKTFANTFDMKNYFAKYTGKDSSIVTIDTDNGRYFLLLERKTHGYPRIRGLKGPVK